MFRVPSIAEIILRAITFLIAMAVHEFAHAYAAYRMGDTTARDMGRMTLNPIKNIDWFGFLMAIAIGFGFLGSAPVNERRMRNPRLGMLVAVAAGPVSNLLLAALCAIPFWFGLSWSDGPSARAFAPTVSDLFSRMVWINLVLFLFNLIPLYPLDGWTIMLKLVPPDLAFTLSRYQQQAMFLFFALIFLGFVGINVFSYIISPPLIFLLRAMIPQRAFF